MSDEPKISERYRELPREEPPRALDEAILRSARRAVDRPHAPLLGPSGRHRWYFSLAAAAVLALAVGVTLHIERDRPADFEAQVPSAAKPEGSRGEAAKQEVARPETKKAAEAARVERRQMERRDMARERSGAAPAASAEPASPRFTPDAPSASRLEGAPAPATAPVPQPMAKPAPNPLDVGAVIASRPAPAPMQRNDLSLRAAAQTAEQELERVADLRRQGRHEEADKALAEFRKRYPDYKIPEAMRERVERR